MSLLVVNVGSSNVKLAVFDGENFTCVWKNRLEFPVENISDWQRALAPVMKMPIHAIGHRVVHGGEIFVKGVTITAEVKQHIQELFPLAPLHNRLNLLGIEMCEQLFPHVAHYAVFDTAFHHTLSEAVFTYPLPIHYQRTGIRRFGFHGISYSYCSKRCAAFLQRPLEEMNIIICHLGAGASLCALKGGKSIDTTMGMTPLEGLMMATRSGSFDPSILLYLLKEKGKIPSELEDELNHHSGLLGISEISSDMRLIEKAAEQGNQQAQLALDMYIHRLRGYLGQMIASLQGVDTLVFTGGIGEHSPWVREQTCTAFSFLGLEIDHQKNSIPSSQEREISTQTSKVRTLVIPTEEEKEIAHEHLLIADAVWM